MIIVIAVSGFACSVIIIIVVGAIIIACICVRSDQIQYGVNVVIT